MSMIDHDDQDRLRAQTTADLDGRRYRHNGSGAVYRIHTQARSPDGPCELQRVDVAGAPFRTTNDRLALDFTRCDPGAPVVHHPSPAAFPTPAELRSRIELEDSAAVQALTESLAAHLTREWSPSKREVIAALQSQPQRVVEAVIARLAASGWKATYRDDQREGRWLSIEVM